MKDNELKIKVKAIQFYPEIDIDEKESITIKRKENIKGIEQFLEKEFRDLECDYCKNESKGTVLAFMNGLNNGVSLSFKDFCCYEFQDKTREILK